MSENVCINCGKPVSGNYCQNCGQRNGVERLTGKTLVEDFLNRVYGLDSAVARTVIELTRNPGKPARAFIAGNRKAYVGPVGYYFLVFALYYLVVAIFKVDLGNIYGDTLVDNPNEAAFLRGIQLALSKYMQFFTLLIFPFLLLWVRPFYGKKYNVVENMVFFFYANAHSILIGTLLSTPFVAISPDAYVYSNTIFSMVFMGYASASFYAESKSFRQILKGFAFWLAGMFTFFAFSFIVGVLIAIFLIPQA